MNGANGWLWKATAVLSLVVVVMGYSLWGRGGSAVDLHAQVQKQIIQLLADHQRLEKELAAEPFAEAGKHPLETYLARVRKDGVPQHSEMRRRLAALADDNAQLLALAESYEPVAKSDAYSAQLRHLRIYVITWNDRWNSLFETFMAGGNLAGSEPEFPAKFSEALQAN